jgi:hypothetical protein
MTKNKTVGAALVAALYFALPHAAHAYHAPGGGEVHVTKCKDQGECYDQASQSCGGGSYQVIDSDSHAGGILADWLVGPVTWYKLMYTCGRSDARFAAFPWRGRQYEPGHSATCTRWGNTAICFGN